MARRRQANRTPWLEVALYSGFGLVVLGGFVVAGLYATGLLDGVQEPSREGQLACPALVRPLEAYAAVSRNDLINPETGQLNVAWLPEQTAQTVVRDLGQILGRVVSRDKATAMVFTEADFFPEGTRPGLAAGIPPGMQAVSVGAEEIDGLSLLRMGDRFDLYAALPSDPDAAPQTEHAVLLGGIKPPDTRAGQLARQTGVRVLVRGGQMIALTRGTSRSTEGQQGLTVSTDRRVREQPVTVATIGVAPEEVTPLTEALGLDTKIICVTYSGRSDDVRQEASEISLDGLQPVVAPYRTIEAFTAIGQESLVDPVSGRLNEYYFAPSRVDTRWLTSFGELVGRVVGRDIKPGEPITEADLLPVGTRPGLVAGAPEGTVVLEASSDRLTGIASLSVGDRLTFYQQLPESVRPAFPEHEWATIQGGQLAPADERLQRTLRSGVQLVAEGVLLLGVREGERAKEAGPGTDSILVLAVPAESVVSFSQAIATENPITVTAEAASPSRPENESPLASTRHDELRLNELIPVANYTVAEEATDANDLVAVPVTARTVPPFTQLSPEDFVDPATGKLREFFFPPEQVDPSWVLSLKDLIDRVSANEIAPGRAVSQASLLPPGTSPGPAAGVPDGYAAIEITSLQVDGLGVAEVLDTIDLVASRPLVAEAAQLKSEWAVLRSDEIFYAPTAEDVFTQADIRTIARSGIVLSKEDREFEIVVETEKETAADEVAIGDDGQTRRGVTRTKEPKVITRKGIAITVAVPAADIPKLTEALSVQRLVGDSGDSEDDDSDSGEDTSRLLNEVLIYAVTHSSRPTVEQPAIPTVDVVRDWFTRWSDQFRDFHSPSEPMVEVRQVEQIRGSNISVGTYVDGQPATEQDAADAVRLNKLRNVLPGRTN